MEKDSWADRVINEVLNRVKEERNIFKYSNQKEGTGLVTSGVGTVF